MLLPEGFSRILFFIDKVQIEQAEWIYQFIMLTSALSERDIFYYKVTGYQCIEILRQ